ERRCLAQAEPVANLVRGGRGRHGLEHTEQVWIGTEQLVDRRAYVPPAAPVVVVGEEHYLRGLVLGERDKVRLKSNRVGGWPDERRAGHLGPHGAGQDLPFRLRLRV